MVQQLCLVDTIPQNKFNFVVNALIAYTGQNPKLLTKATSLYKPNFNMKKMYNSPQVMNNNSINLNQIEQYIVQVHEQWVLSERKTNGNKTKTSAEEHLVVNDILKNNNESFFKKYKKDVEEADMQEKQGFSLQISDIPAAGKRSVSAQTIYESFIEDSKLNVKKYLFNLGFKEYRRVYIRGIKFHLEGGVFIEVFQVLVASNRKYELLDSSENWMCKVYTNVRNGTDVNAASKATAELQKIQTELQGILALQIPDRMSMDSRVSEKQ